jgi:hypothetical protein
VRRVVPSLDEGDRTGDRGGRDVHHRRAAAPEPCQRPVRRRRSHWRPLFARSSDQAVRSSHVQVAATTTRRGTTGRSCWRPSPHSAGCFLIPRRRSTLSGRQPTRKLAEMRVSWRGTVCGSDGLDPCRTLPPSDSRRSSARFVTDANIGATGAASPTANASLDLGAQRHRGRAHHQQSARVAPATCLPPRRARRLSAYTD